MSTPKHQTLLTLLHMGGFFPVIASAHSGQEMARLALSCAMQLVCFAAGEHDVFGFSLQERRAIQAGEGDTSPPAEGLLCERLWGSAQLSGGLNFGQVLLLASASLRESSTAGACYDLVQQRSDAWKFPEHLR